jgi:hypothetical protein
MGSPEVAVSLQPGCARLASGTATRSATQKTLLDLCSKEIAMKRTVRSAVLVGLVFLTAVSPSVLMGQAGKRLVSPDVQPDGKVTFRLVAPKAEKVALQQLGALLGLPHR